MHGTPANEEFHNCVDTAPGLRACHYTLILNKKHPFTRNVWHLYLTIDNLILILSTIKSFMIKS